MNQRAASAILIFPSVPIAISAAAALAMGLATVFTLWPIFLRMDWRPASILPAAAVATMRTIAVIVTGGSHEQDLVAVSAAVGTCVVGL